MGPWGVVMTTYTLEGFIDTLEQIIRHAEGGRLVSCSINLSPDGLGHYAYQLLDGTAMPGLAELVEPSDENDPTPPTAPGKSKRGKK